MAVPLVRAQFDELIEFEHLLNLAQARASKDLDRDFVKNIAGRYRTFAGQTYLSDAQHNRLESIATR